MSAKLGREFLSSVLAKMPEDKRAAFATLMDDPSATEALTAIGEGVLRQEDYSRRQEDLRTQMTAVETKAAEQARWWETAEPLAKLGESAQKAGWKPGTPPASGTSGAADVPADVVRQADLDRRDGQAVTYFNYGLKLALRHQRELGADLDLQALTDAALKNQRTLDQEYDAQFGAQYAAKRQAALDAEVAKRVQEGVDAELKKRGAAPAYPVSPTLGSPLDALEPVKGKLGMDDLEAAYYEAVGGVK